MRYEMFYNLGGHSGPYATLQKASEHAGKLLRGWPSLQSILIVERTSTDAKGYGGVVAVITQKDLEEDYSI